MGSTLTIRLRFDELQALRALSFVLDRPVSELVRQWIEKAFDEEYPKSVALFTRFYDGG